MGLKMEEAHAKIKAITGVFINNRIQLAGANGRTFAVVNPYNKQVNREILGKKKFKIFTTRWWQKKCCANKKKLHQVLCEMALSGQLEVDFAVEEAQRSFLRNYPQMWVLGNLSPHWEELSSALQDILRPSKRPNIDKI